MAGYLNYAVYTRGHRLQGQISDKVQGPPLMSGTIASTSTKSADVTIAGAASAWGDLVLRLQNFSATPVYVIHRAAGASAPSGTGAHAASDTQARMLIRQEDGPLEVLVRAGDKIAAVDAAAFS
jgi:hypothetical protein